jgi:hypothetical protein
MTMPTPPVQIRKEVAQSTKRTVGTQSLYRENEAQTYPYSPAYIIPEGTNPEILQLARLGLNYGQGTLDYKVSKKSKW